MASLVRWFVVWSPDVCCIKGIQFHRFSRTDLPSLSLPLLSLQFLGVQAACSFERLQNIWSSLFRSASSSASSLLSLFSYQFCYQSLSSSHPSSFLLLFYSNQLLRLSLSLSLRLSVNFLSLVFCLFDLFLKSLFSFFVHSSVILCFLFSSFFFIFSNQDLRFFSICLWLIYLWCLLPFQHKYLSFPRYSFFPFYFPSIKNWVFFSVHERK